jgi:hypothetical protein
MSTSLLTKEVKERIERRFEWAVENEMRANSQYAQYKQDITTLMAEIGRLEAEIITNGVRANAN